MKPFRKDLFPYAAREFKHANGLVQRYVDEGTGAPVLMVHGNPTWGFYYRHLIAALRGTHRCIVPDHIGMGRSDKPDDSQYNFSLQERVDDLDALTDHLISEGAPERGWTLVVHDWGGMIGFAWAVRHPERIARIIVLNTAAFLNPKGLTIPLALRLGRDTRVGEWLILNWNAFAWGAARFGASRLLDADVREAYLAPYDTPAHRLATLRFVEDIPLRPDDGSYALVRATGQKLEQFANVPMLICWGLNDFVFDRAFYDEFVKRFPNAEKHPYSDAGHLVLEDAHERIVPLLPAFMARGAG
jgi:cis-3-alkyl-4-acyloxetan-2-one decarboxylase